MQTFIRTQIALFAIGAFFTFAGAAQALSLGNFSCITDNDAGNCAIGEANLSADLTGDVLTITMTGSDSAVIEQVFIEGTGVTGGVFVSGVGLVDFDDAVAGGNLPGGNPVGFVSHFNFAADNPAPRDGIGYHSQDMTVVQTGVFELTGDLSDLRIGVHVIGFENGGSESFVTGRPGDPIPEPSAALVFGAGLLVVGRRVRKQKA